MIIVAESGSTKTNWLTENKELFETIGFNPLFFSSEDIYRELMKQKDLLKMRDQVTQVLFYGASCSSDDRKKIVYDSLKKYFPKAESIQVDHDMNAAAFATYDGRPGIACILGTGSNSCLFDGKKVYEEVPALGYMLGDEGSGAYFGKKLLALYLYHELPEATTEMLKEQYGLEKEKIFDAVYKKPHVNVYLASFAQVMTDSPDKDFMRKFAQEGFNEFFFHHVCCYKNYQQYPVHFVGSIAYHFKDALKKIADKYGSELGIVDKNPVYRLLEWHLKKENVA
jgi:glucosamine kinase